MWHSSAYAIRILQTQTEKRSTMTEHNASQDELWVARAYTQTIEIMLSKSIRTGEIETLINQLFRRASK